MTIVPSDVHDKAHASMLCRVRRPTTYIAKSFLIILSVAG